jgi:hypothetical protein
MNDQKITEWLQTGTGDLPAPTRFCPPPERIAEYFEGLLSDSDRQTLKRHLAECRYCFARLGNLARVVDESRDTAVSGPVLAEAKALANNPSRKRHFLRPTWAAAAVLVLAVSMVTLLGPQIGDVPVTPSSDAVPTPVNRMVRSNGLAVSRPDILNPTQGSSINSGELTIMWTVVPGSLHYDVRVVNTAGFIVWQDRSEGTVVQPPIGDLLVPGESYFVRVDAYLAEANNSGSEHVLFTVREDGE